jgi:hypothetical protein
MIVIISISRGTDRTAALRSYPDELIRFGALSAQVITSADAMGQKSEEMSDE